MKKLKKRKKRYSTRIKTMVNYLYKEYKWDRELPTMKINNEYTILYGVHPNMVLCQDLVQVKMRKNSSH